MENWEEIRKRVAAIYNKRMPEGQRIESMSPAVLAGTLATQRAMGSTPSQLLIDNPTKTVAETMDDAELKAYIIKEIDDARERYKLGPNYDSQYNPRGKEIMKLQVTLLKENIKYLREINRLPTELMDFDPEKEFPLSE